MARYYSDTYPRVETKSLEAVFKDSEDFSEIFDMKVDESTLYGKIVNIPNLLESYKKSTRGGTRYKRGSVTYNKDLFYYLADTYARLYYELYYPYRYDRFILEDPKERIIDVPPHPDKVVHHMVNNVLLPIFSKKFIPDSYACVKGKGTSKAVERIIEFQRLSIQEYGEDCRFLKLDVSKFFPSINQDVLKYIIRKHINCESTCNLLERIIYGYPKEKGLPLGNLLSQLFANIYMNEFDVYAKNKLNIKYYVRYADDIFIFAPNREIAKEWMGKCINFASYVLKLVINPQKCHITKPNKISGLGYIIEDGVKYLRKKSLNNFKRFAHCKDIKRMNSWYIHGINANCYNFILRTIAGKGILFFPNDPVPFRLELLEEQPEQLSYELEEFIFNEDYKNYYH